MSSNKEKLLVEIKNSLKGAEEDGFTEVLSWGMRLLGIPYFAYVYVHQHASHFNDIFIASNYPEAWIDKYKRKSLYKVDPVISTASCSSQAFCWSDLNLITDSLFTDSKDYGIEQGYSVPVHEPGNTFGALNLAAPFDHGDIKSIVEGQIQVVIYISHLAHTYRPASVREKPTARLTEREKECLYWASIGKTYTEIGLILEISGRTVKYHINNAMQKLNACNVRQALSLAIRNNYI